MDAEDLRRLWPPPRRRPNVFDVLVRWRIEIVLSVLVAAACRDVGGEAVAITAAVLLASAIAIPPFRHIAVRCWELLAAPHRVRAGLVQGGIADRLGFLPWVLWAVPASGRVRVDLAMRGGTTYEDVRRAAPVIAGACGAAEIEVTQRRGRPDRVSVTLLSPRWGFP